MAMHTINSLSKLKNCILIGDVVTELRPSTILYGVTEQLLKGEVYFIFNLSIDVLQSQIFTH